MVDASGMSVSVVTAERLVKWPCIDRCRNCAYLDCELWIRNVSSFVICSACCYCVASVDEPTGQTVRKCHHPERLEIDLPFEDGCELGVIKSRYLE
jgi:hypothetical protein